MKVSRPVQLLLVGVLSGLIGYGLGNGPAKQADERKLAGDISGRSPKAGRNGPARSVVQDFLTPEMRGLFGDQPVSESATYDFTTRILVEKDPARRLAALGLIIDSMTPATASAIRQAFLDNTANTGRRNNGAWDFMIRKFGATLGLAALDQIKNNPGEAALAIEGWAMADSDSALAHLRKMDPASPGYSQSCAAILSGIAKTDPGKSFQLILNNPDLTINSQDVVTSAVQSLGIEEATLELQSALDGAPPEAAQSPAFRKIFTQLSETAIHQNWISGHSEKVLPWLEQQKGQPFLTDQVVDHAAKNVALQGKMTEALDWLDRMNDAGAPSMGNSGIRSAVMKDPSLLSDLDEATFNRVIARFPPKSPEMKFLADAIEPTKPAYASRLRGAGQ